MSARDPHSSPTSPQRGAGGVGGGGKLVSARVILLNDSVHNFQIPPRAPGRELYYVVMRKLQIIESDYFDLEYVDKEGIRCWLDHDKTLSKQFGSCKDLIFSLGVKFYTPHPNLLEEEYTRYLFALQIKKDIVNGFLPCNDNTSALLASYLVQMEIGDFLEEEYHDHGYLKTLKILHNPSDNMLMKVMEYHKTHIGLSPAEAEFHLLDTARKVELYGIRMHPAKDHEGLPLNLAVAHMGIIVFQHATKINTFSWAKIRKLSFKRKKFLIKLHPEGYGYYKDTVEFYFESRDECKNFWKKCIEHHAFFRCQAVKKAQRRKTRVVSKGSSFRYSGRTQKQLIEYVRENCTRRPLFERPSSSCRVSSKSPSASRHSGGRLPALHAASHSAGGSTGGGGGGGGLGGTLNSSASARSRTVSTSSGSHTMASSREHLPHLRSVSQSPPARRAPPPSRSRSLGAEGEDSLHPGAPASDAQSSHRHPQQHLGEAPMGAAASSDYRLDPGDDDLDLCPAPVSALPPSVVTGTSYGEYSPVAVNPYDRKMAPPVLSSFQQQRPELTGNNIGHRRTPQPPPRHTHTRHEETRDFAPERERGPPPPPPPVTPPNMHGGSYGRRHHHHQDLRHSLHDDEIDVDAVNAPLPPLPPPPPPPPHSGELSSRVCAAPVIDAISGQTPLASATRPTTLLPGPASLPRPEDMTILRDEDDRLPPPPPPPPLPPGPHPATLSYGAASSYGGWSGGGAHSVATHTLTTLSSMSGGGGGSSSRGSQSDGALGGIGDAEDERSWRSLRRRSSSKKGKYPSDRAYYIAKELLMTERTYKKDLEVTCVWLRKALASGSGEVKFPDWLSKELYNLIDPIYDYHVNFLKEVESRLAHWDGKIAEAGVLDAILDTTSSEGGFQRVGDLLLANMKMLPLYRRYFEQQEALLHDLERTIRSHSPLEQAVRGFEAGKTCYLPLYAFLLAPSHRLLHYRLLLERLMRLYDSSHPDYHDCRLSHAQLTEVIHSYRECNRRMENRYKLLELQRDLIGVDCLLPPSPDGLLPREFIREGWLQKLSKKGYQQRMFFLFSDQLLYASRTASPFLQFKIHGQFPLRDLLMVEEGQAPHSLTIYTESRCFLVAALNDWQRDRWVEDISKAILAAKTSPQPGGNGSCIPSSGPPSTTSTMSTSSQVPVERHQIQQRANTSTHVCWHRNTTLSIADIARSNECQISGYLLRKFKNSNGWQKLWVVFTQLCLFFYKSYQDDSPLASLPLLGYSVALPEESDGIRKDNVFRLKFKNHIYFFRAESRATFDRWFEVISVATGGVHHRTRHHSSKSHT